MSENDEWTYEVPSNRDSTFSAADTGDKVQDFFERPVLVHSGTIEIDQAYQAAFNPWRNFFEDPKVLARLKNFRNLRCDMRVKILLNGNPFYYGSLLVSYAPLHALDDRTTGEKSTMMSLMQHSQFPHLYLDPSTNVGGDMVLPYFYYKDALNVPYKEWRNLGVMRIESLQALQHANAGTEPITISVFAMATNVQLSTPTFHSPIENQGDEYLKPSSVAHGVAKVAGWLTSVPVIAPYARATEMISSAAGNFASLFGFSAPREIRESTSYRNRPITLAVTNVPDNVGGISVDAKKEVTIDPRVVGLPPSDEMVLTPIAMRECFTDLFPWNENDATGAHLFSVRVDPVQMVQDGSDYQLSPSAYVTLPFKWWRGSMRFRFNVIASAYHRGRLKFVWDPDFCPADSGNTYNTNYTTIVDITNQRDITLDIGWGQEYSYLPVSDIGRVKTQEDAFITSSRFSNGTLSVFVVNTLTSPGPDPSEVSVALFTSMKDDFEVAGPDAKIFSGGIKTKTLPVAPDEEDVVNEPPVPPPDDEDVNPPTWPPETPPEPPPPLDELVFDGFALGGRTIPFQVMPSTMGRDDADGKIKSGNPDGAVAVHLPTLPRWKGTLTISSTEPSLDLLLASRVSTATTTNFDQVEFTGATPDVATLYTVNFDLAVPQTGNSGHLYINPKLPGSTSNVSITFVKIQIDGLEFHFFRPDDLTFSIGTTTNNEHAWTFPNVGTGLEMTLPRIFDPTKTTVHHLIEGTQGRLLHLSPNNEKMTITHSSNGLYNSVSGIAGTYEGAGGVPKYKLSAFNGDNVGEEYKLFSIVFVTKGIENQALVYENQADEVETEPTGESSAPIALNNDAVMAPRLPGLEVNSVYFGEKIISWRQMIKRYSTQMQYTADNRKFIWNSGIADQSDTAALALLSLTPIDYISSAFVGKRGGMRLRIIPDVVEATSAPYVANVAISNLNSNVVTNDALVTALPNFAGVTWDPVHITGTADAEIPYYSNLRFMPARMSGTRLNDPLGYQFGEVSLQAGVYHKSTTTFRWLLNVAAAEDYSLHFFLAAPMLTTATF